jgi:hypothetical protein
MSILVLTSDTLIGTAATGNIEYNGQFYGTDSAASRAQIERVTLSTAVASTSGTSITFSSLPAWVKRITVMFNGVSTSGTSSILIQIGAGSVTNTGYASVGTRFGAASGASGNYTTGFGIFQAAAADIIGGAIQLNNHSSNIWVASGATSATNSTSNMTTSGYISLSGVLDRVVITTVNGTDTFDAGSINILYEG